MADLDRLLELVRPSKLVQPDFEAESAYKDFKLEKPMVDTFPEFEELMGRYYLHLMRRIHKTVDLELPKEDAQALAMDLVYRTFEGRSVEAFERAKEGWDGGLVGVLRAICDAFKKDLLEKYIVHALTQMTDMEDLEDCATLARAYLERFGGNLPAEALPIAELFAARLPELVKTHIQVQELAQRLRWQMTRGGTDAQP